MRGKAKSEMNLNLKIDIQEGMVQGYAIKRQN